MPIIIGTYNMEHGGVNPWAVVNKLTSQCDIVCLQECGPPPNWDNNDFVDKGDIKYGYYKGILMYHLRYGTGVNQQCSAAILVPNEDLKVLGYHWYDPPAAHPGQRRLMLLKIGKVDKWASIGTIHAPAGNGWSPHTADYVKYMISKVAGAAANWILAGDFNYMANALALPKGKIIPPTHPTHKNGGYYDYVVTSLTGACTSVGNVGSADHAPAIYTIDIDL